MTSTTPATPTATDLQPTTHPSADRTQPPVAVVGLGEMGRALAATLLDAGHPVTVWNRTPGRAADVVARGAVAAPTVQDALSAAPLVLLCVLDAAAVDDLLADSADALSGRTLVNLTTTTPDQTRRTATWAAERDIAYLDAGIMAVPAMIGTPAASILYSGAADAFDQHAPVLERLGSASHLGAEPGLASLVDLSMLSAMYTLFAGVYQAVAMAQTGGVSAARLLPSLVPFLQAMAASAGSAAAALDDRDHSGQAQSLGFTRAAVDLIVRAAREQGVEPSALTAVQTLIEGEIDRGHVDRGTTGLLEAFSRAAA